MYQIPLHPPQTELNRSTGWGGDLKKIKSITAKKESSLRTRLALGTALATIALGYGGRGAYAGVCNVTVSPNFVCTGAAGADLTQSLSASGLSVTTDNTFGLNVAVGDGLNLTGSGAGGVTFNDANSSAITGNTNGIRARINNDGSTGAVSITSTGTVTGVFNSGIRADNYSTTGTGITISANIVSGGASGSGIRARINNYSSSGDISITATQVSGAAVGITASSLGTGAVNVISTGPVTGNYYYGINASGNGDMTITTGDVSGNYTGIRAINSGGGTMTINVSGTVSGVSYDGIDTQNNYGTTNITINGGGSVVGGNGIAIDNDNGTSNVTVNAGASVTGAITLGGGADNVVIDGGTVTLGGVSDAETITVTGGGTLGGSGTVSGDVAIGDGTLSAGNSPGLLEIVGNLDLGAASTTLVELEGLIAGTEYDQTDVSSGIATLAAGATFDIDFFGVFNAGLGDSFDVLVADDIVSDLNSLTFDFTNALLASGLDWNTSLFTFSGGANDGREALRLTVISEVVAVPEPSSLSLFASLLGLIGLGRARRRRQAGQSD
jgi:hypothetical protein